MDQQQPDKPQRFQFSLRAALLLTPLAAGWLYLHVLCYQGRGAMRNTATGLAFIDLTALGALVVKVGVRLAQSPVWYLRIAGVAIAIVGVISAICLSEYVFAAIRNA
jgi:hypothetical protein